MLQLDNSNNYESKYFLKKKNPFQKPNGGLIDLQFFLEGTFQLTTESIAPLSWLRFISENFSELPNNTAIFLRKWNL